jgi:hypothetical protein
MRFTRSFDPGFGDCTQDPKKNLTDKTVKQIDKEILERQKSKQDLFFRTRGPNFLQMFQNRHSILNSIPFQYPSLQFF